MTDVTIRGIDDEVYSLFSAEARKRNVPIGELVTQVMKIFLEETSEERFIIENLPELTITKSELESVGAPIAFIGINILVISDEVDWELFKQYIDEIRRVKSLTIPKSLSKFQVLTKCKNIGKIIQKE